MNKLRCLKKRTGAAMWIALVLLAITSIGATATWRHMHLTMKYQKIQEKQEMCRNLAEGGLESAVAHLRTNREYQGESDTTLGKGTFTVSVRKQKPEIFLLKSTGVLDDYHQEMYARLELNKDGLVNNYCLLKEDMQ